MKPRFLLPSLLLLFVTMAASAQDSVIVRTVVSATSITLSSGDTVTLLGLGLLKSQAVDADDARDHLASLVEGTTVVLAADSMTGDSRERFVYADGDLVNLSMIRDGYATASTIPSHSKVASFKAAENDARAHQSGAWATERSAAVQCSGTTKKGDRCKRTTTSLNGRCWQHQ